MAATRREKLLNVRVSNEEAAMAAQLREHGVELSELVREAIRSEYGRRRRLRPGDVEAILDSIHARHPDPPAPAARPDVHDRRAFRAAVRRRVRRHGAP